MGETILRCGLSNAIIDNITKTEAILLSKACSQKAKEEIAASRLIFGGQVGKFNNKATKGLEVLLDSKLILKTHIKEPI